MPAWSRTRSPRVACETGNQDPLCWMCWRVTTNAHLNYDELARKVITEIGYDSSEKALTAIPVAFWLLLPASRAILPWAWIKL